MGENPKEIKKTPRQIASVEKKNRIFDVSLHLFRTYGYDNVTISDISEKSGMATGSIYHYFGSKEGILSNLGEHISDITSKLIQPTEEYLSKPQDTLVNYYLNQGEVFSRLGWELTQKYYLNSKLTSDLVTFQGLSGNAVISSYSPEVLCFVKKLIESKRYIGTHSAEDVTSIMLILCNGLTATWALTKGSFDLLEVSETVFRNQLSVFGIY